MGELHRFCYLGALVGLLLGVSGVAWSQDPASSPSSAPVGDADLWLRLLSSGGLPAVLGFLGYWLPRAALGLVQGAAAAVALELREGITVRLSVPEEGIALRLSADQLEELGRLLEARAPARSVRTDPAEVA